MSANTNSRLEAFCDGVFAIALTLLVIDIKVPDMENIHSSEELWLALKHILPTIFAFLLSFGIILITWVNHHAAVKLVDKSSAPFIYANGFLLLTVVFIPFPTALLGESLLTDHASPAVVLYAAIDGVQAIGWTLFARTALKGKLFSNEKTEKQLKKIFRDSFSAIALYTICTVLAIWFPITIAIAITVIWIAWLIYGINIKE